jgi:hypothetical protein
VNLLVLSGNREQGTGNREQGTGNREQGTGNREQGTGNREQGTGNRQQGTAKTELIPPESCIATPRRLSKIKYYSYIISS